MKRLFAAALLFLIAAIVPAQQPKIAIIGLVHCHVWGHLDKMVKGEPAKLVGVAESIPDLVAEAKSKGVAEALFYKDYLKMLDETKPEIVWAFVENNRHVEIVKACAARKIHVMFEKPLASSYEDALTIRNLARQAGIMVMTNYQMAWWPSNYTGKQVADSGKIGKIFRLRGIVGHGGPPRDGVNKYFIDWLADPVKNGAGALMDFQCYNAVWALWFLGRPLSVSAQVQTLRPDLYPKVDDHSTMLLGYKNGSGIFEGSWNLPYEFQDLEVFGDKGILTVKGTGVTVRTGGMSAGRSTPMIDLAPEKSEPIAYMISCIKANKPLEGLVAEDFNVSVMEIVDAARASIKTGQTITLPEVNR